MDASCNAKPAVVAVVGPTATGKTALGVALAQQFSGEVISADSMQIYKGLDVGTAKVTPQELMALAEKILSGEVPPFCPHGRPCVLKLTRKELEKQFGRIV